MIFLARLPSVAIWDRDRPVRGAGLSLFVRGAGGTVRTMPSRCTRPTTALLDRPGNCRAMLLALIQPSKGAVIAMQWWHGMHGFRRERHPESDEDAA